MSRSHGELEHYLQEIGRTNLLTPLEERELGWSIINDGCHEAKDRLIRANLRLVVAISKNYNNRGMTLSDLIEEGNVGLIRAAEGFDPAQGARFSTYASWWIKQAIKRTLLHARQPVHIPAYMVELIARAKELARDFEQKHGRPPTDAEMAKSLSVPPRKYAVVRQAMDTQSASTISTANDDEQRGFSETFADASQVAPEEQTGNREIYTVVMELLDVIDERDASILRLRFGLQGEQPLTLKEIGARIGLTRERVRQLESEALGRIRSALESGHPVRWFEERRKLRQG